MKSTISLTYALEKLNDFLPLTRAEIEVMPVSSIRSGLAKVLGVAKSHQMKKAELVEVCWRGLENVRAQLVPVKAEKPEYKMGEGCFAQAHTDYTIELEEMAQSIYARLKDIGNRGKDFQQMKDATNGVVAAVAASENAKYKFSTIKGRRTALKKHLDYYVKTENPLLKETYGALAEYFFTQLLSYQMEDSIRLNKTYKAQVREKNTSKKEVEVGKLVADCRETLAGLIKGEDPKWARVSVAIALGTGRRMAEIHSLGSFEVTGEYEMYFSGQAKTREAEGAKSAFSIPTLFPAEQLKAGIDYLGKQGRRLPAEEQEANRDAVNKTFSMALSRAMKGYSIDYKGLRALYAECMWYLLPEAEKARTEKHVKYSEWLGHISQNGAGDTTFMSYMVWQILDLDCL